MAVDSSIQRITRLTPLSAILALIDSRVGAVTPQKSAIHAARDFTLAEDVVSSERPPRPIALRDGFPVDAATVADAGPYAPVPLPPTARRIDVGEALPSDTDAVLPLDAVTLRGHRAEAVAAVTAGEGVLPNGGDATPRTPLRRAGQSARAIDIAVMAAAGIKDVTVRAPRIHIVYGGEARSPAIGVALTTLMRVAGEGWRRGYREFDHARTRARGRGNQRRDCRRRHRQRTARCRGAYAGAARPGRGARHRRVARRNRGVRLCRCASRCC